MTIGHVSAHNPLLAGVSPVFRKLFFGPMNNTDDVVDIKETNIEVFKPMINFIYSLPEFSCISWEAAFSGTFIIPVPDYLGVVIRSSVV